MTALIIGIDPGLTGALAAINGAGELVGVWDAPTIAGRGGKRDYLPSTMHELLNSLISGSGAASGAILAVVEGSPGRMPHGSIASSYQQGRGVGLWEGLLAGLQIPYRLIAPATWQAALGLRGQPKPQSLIMAQRLFPTAELASKRGRGLDGRADALLIAFFGAALQTRGERGHLACCQPNSRAAAGAPPASSTAAEASLVVASAALMSQAAAGLPSGRGSASSSASAARHGKLAAEAARAAASHAVLTHQI